MSGQKPRVMVIDGQGGGIGRQVIAGIKAKTDAFELIGIGTNSLAASAMLKAGAAQAATGENSVLVAARTAEVIICPIGMVIADSLLGEVTPAMAVAIGQSRAKKILIPVNQCDNIVVGVPDTLMETLIQGVWEKLRALFSL